MYLNGVKLLPITGFSLYWLFYGSLDLIHFFGFSSLFVKYYMIISYFMQNKD